MEGPLPADQVEELLRLRDALVWDWRSGVRTREGEPPLSTRAVAIVFGVTPRYVRMILRRGSRRRERELVALRDGPPRERPGPDDGPTPAA